MGAFVSMSEARRVVIQKGLKVNGELVEEASRLIDEFDEGEEITVQVGKNKKFKVIVGKEGE